VGGARKAPPWRHISIKVINEEGIPPRMEAILKVEDDLRKDGKNKEALVDALLVQEILSSVIHYFASDLLSAEERQAIVDPIIDCDRNYGEKAASNRATALNGDKRH
jgi:hypothetical protein